MSSRTLSSPQCFCAAPPGDLWLIADDDVLAEQPDIVRSGLPLVRFSELEHLQRLDAASLLALGVVKRTFPRARVLQ